MARHLTRQELIRGYKLCQKRIDISWRKRQRVEAVLYMSLLVEYFVKEAILSFEKIVEGAAIGVNVGFNPRNLYSKQDIESQPLGYLIKTLDTYTKDKSLIKDLRHFAGTRNGCVHKLFGRSISEVNRELKDFNVFFYKLMLRLLQLNLDQRNHIEKSFHPICDLCFREMLPRQVKL